MWFNDTEPFVAAWLRNLFPGATVDERSITDLDAASVAGLRRAHFFAGIGGWQYALELAGWPANREVWTGSCPCQPFSAAGKRRGEADERHLWPAFQRLIAECRPATIFGEQVASRAGREWLAGVRADLEALGYVVGAADLCAAGIGAPHIRQRLFWVADADIITVKRRARSVSGPQETVGGAGQLNGSEPDGHSDGGEALRVEQPASIGRVERWAESGWGSPELRRGSDGKCRRIEPGLEPLAHGIPGRASIIRAYGNAIVPQLAAVFVKAFMETEDTEVTP